MTILPSATASAVTVPMAGHAVVHRFDVDEAESFATYDIEYFLDSWGRSGNVQIVLQDGEGTVMGRGYASQGGSYRFTGTLRIGGSWRATPEQMTKLTVRLYQQVGYPATIYDNYDSIDVGWRSPSPSGEVSVRDIYTIDNKLFFDLDVRVKSPGGSADEPCGYLAPYGLCFIRAAMVSPSGDILTTYWGEQYLQTGNHVTNVGTSGFDLSAYPEGSSLQVAIVGSMTGQPNRYYALGPVRDAAFDVSSGIELRSTPTGVKRNTESVTLVAALTSDLGSFGAEQPGVAIVELETGAIIGACEGERKCSALIPFVEETPHAYAAFVADFADPEKLVMAPESPSDVLALPNLGGPSDYELAGGYIPSAECSSSSVADPVNTATGEFFERSRDLAMPCIGPPVTFERTYSTSFAETSGPLGFGWRHNYQMSIEPVDATTFDEASAVDVVQENGSRVRFYGSPHYGYDAAQRVRATLTYGSDGTWTFVRDQDATFTFDPAGDLVTLADANGNTVRLSYAEGKLTQVADDFGRSLSIQWQGDSISAVSDQAGRTVTFAYNARGDLITATDYDGVAERYRYDSAHRVTRLIAASGVETQNTYDAQGRVVAQTSADGQNYQFAYAEGTTSVTGPTGLVTQEQYQDNLLISTTTGVGTALEATSKYAYDIRNNLQSITDAYGHTSRFQYDEWGRKISAEDPLGNQRRWLYDAQGDLIQTVNSLGTVEVRYEYDARGNLTAERHADGRVIEYTNNERGLVTRVDGPGDSFESYAYDVAGNRVSLESSDGTRSEVEYDPLSRPTVERRFSDRDGDGVEEVDVSTITYNNRSQITSTTGPDGATTAATFDARGRLRVSKDAAGSARRITYDSLSRVATETDTLGNVTAFEYDAVGRVAAVTLPNGGRVEYSYDARGLLVVERDPLGRETRHEYDLVGRRTATTDPEGRRTAWTYDAAGRQESEIAPGGSVTTFEYNALGNRSAVTDAEGRRTTFAYDAQGRLTTLTRPGGATWTYTHDAFGVVAETDWLGRTLERTRDEFGRTVQTVDFNGHVSSTTFRDGWVASETSPSGVTSNYSYDANGRVAQIGYSNGRASSVFAYDARGWLTSAVDDGGTVRYAYDREGRITTVAGKLGRTTYARDAMGNVTTMTYPAGLVVSYEYDATEQLVHAKVGDVVVATNEFDGSGLVSSTVLGNGVANSYSRSATGAVTGIETQSGAAQPLFDANYGYDRTSLLASAQLAYGGEVSTSLVLGRDAVGRVSSVSPSGQPAVPLTYRSSHEVLSTDTGTAVAFDAQGLPTAFDTASGDPVALTYDALGRRTSETASSGAVTSSYTFDDFDRLTDVTVDGDRHRYRYAHGLRVSDRDVSEQSTTVFRWDVSGSVARLLEDGDKAYVYGMGTSPFAQVDLATGELEYLHGDLVGSTRVVTDAAGTVVSTFEYSAYGELIDSTGDAGSTSFLFAGEYRDPTGLYYLRARFLDTRVGQFLSLDPMGTVTGMPYAYTAGDPFMQTDPLGLFSVGPVDVNEYASGVWAAASERLVGTAQMSMPWLWDDLWRSVKCGAEAQGGGFGGWATQLTIQANPVYGTLDGFHMFKQGVGDGNWYAAGYGGANFTMGLADTALIAAGGYGIAAKVTSAAGRSATVLTSSSVVSGAVTSQRVVAPLWTSTKTSSAAANALRHFNDHGSDFTGVSNALEYVAEAQSFLRSPPPGTLTRMRSNGDVVRYQPSSNTFGVMDSSGAPRTFFKPDPSQHGYATNLDYFNAQ
jgi:RHS repeat-associated protein